MVKLPFIDVVKSAEGDGLDGEIKSLVLNTVSVHILFLEQNINTR